MSNIETWVTIMLAAAIVLLGAVIFFWLKYTDDNKQWKKHGIFTGIGALIFALSFIVAWPIAQGILGEYNKKHTEQILDEQKENCGGTDLTSNQCEKLLDTINGKNGGSYVIEDK